MPVAATVAAMSSAIAGLAAASSEGWRLLAGLVKWVSSGQKMGHIIGARPG